MAAEELSVLPGAAAAAGGLLNRLLPWTGWLFQPRFWLAMGGVLLLALALVSRRWDEFTHTFSAYGGLSAAIGIGLSLSLAKILHEMGHALTARHFGRRVPAMGVAFLVMMPVLYTDTNDAWKLNSRRQRLLIGGAGMLAELVLAAWATLLWSFLPDGPCAPACSCWPPLPGWPRWPSMPVPSCALTATSCWPTTWACPICTTAPSRWRAGGCAKRCWAWTTRCRNISPRRGGAAILFAWATWLYRLVLFLSIAFLVYHLFFKALGLLLLAVELGWFIARPIVGELMVWWQRRADLRWCRQTRRSAAALLILSLALILPWQREVASPAVLGALQSQGLYAPAAGEVAETLVRDGQSVKAGQVLARLHSSSLEAQLALASARERDLAWQTAQQPFDPELQQRGPALRKQWQVAQEQVATLRQQMARLTLTAPFAGRAVDVSDALRAGTAVAEGERLLDVVGPDGVKGEAFIDEAALSGLKPGHVARFVADGGEFLGVECRLGQIDRLNLPLLDQPLLASTYGGPIPTEQREHGLVPLAATFRVRLEQCERRGAPLRELAGVARLQGSATVCWSEGCVSCWRCSAGRAGCRTCSKSAALRWNS